MSDGGSAQPVVPVTTGLVSAAPALRVAVVSDGRPTLGGPSLPVYVVTDNRPTQGNTPVPVVLATGQQAGNVMAGPAIPVVVVSGSLNPAPVNTVLPSISGTLYSGVPQTYGNNPHTVASVGGIDGTALNSAIASLRSAFVQSTAAIQADSTIEGLFATCAAAVTTWSAA